MIRQSISFYLIARLTKLVSSSAKRNEDRRVEVRVARLALSLFRRLSLDLQTKASIKVNKKVEYAVSCYFVCQLVPMSVDNTGAVMRHAVAAKVALVSVVLLLGLIASPGAIRHFILAVAAPRPVEPRGDLSEMEHSIIASFERVSPSVVQIAGSVPHSPSSAGEDEIQSGTGFVWEPLAISSPTITLLRTRENC